MSTASEIVLPASPRPPGSPLAGVKHVIAIGSGKGGVGKSTTAVNLSAALAALGARVGLLDADVYGPSVPRMLGGDAVEPVQDPQSGKILPPSVNGVKVMSMALLSATEAPVVWRGPMASRAISQFLGEVEWGELDYLLIDLPPGTGDIQITLAQSARLSGAVIVTTPQKLAASIAGRGLKMFQQVRVPVIGLVENMSEYHCPECGHVSALFRKGGGETTARELGLPLLAALPYDADMVEEGDEGRPVVWSRPNSSSAQSYLNLARKMVAELSTILSGGRSDKPLILSLEPHAPSKIFKVSWSDGVQSLASFRDLRYWCPCANCVDENSGVRKITKESIPEDISPQRVQTIGNYALGIHWSDGHQTGIYSYDYLRKRLVSSGASSVRTGPL